MLLLIYEWIQGTDAARLVVRLGHAGVTARGVVFCFIGWLVVTRIRERRGDNAEHG